MARGLEDAETTPVRALAVGSSEWIRTATTGLADEPVTVAGSVSTAADLADEQVAAVDCVLTDERDVLDAVDGTCPVVYAVDPAQNESVDQLRDDGAAAILAKTTIQEPPLLVHRLRRAVRFDALQREGERRVEWYQTVLEQLSELLIVFDPDGTITYASPAVERVGQYDVDDLQGTHFREYIHPDDTESVLAEFDAVREADCDTSRTIEYTCRHGDGAWYVHEAVLTNRIEDGVVDGVVASIRDITEYRRIEQELTESFKRVTDAFYALDADWRFTYVNDRAIEKLGFERSELLGRKILDVFPNLHGTAFQRKAVEAMDRQEPRTVEAYFEPYDAWIEARIFPSPSGVSVYWRDVTERIERERNLAERTERLQTMVENVPVVLFVLDEDGTFTLSEGRGLENVGIDSAELVGESFFERFDDYPDTRADARAALDGEAIHSRRHIEDRVFENWYRPIAADDGSVDRVIGVANDVTERVQYQAALNALHEATSHLLTVDSKDDACEYIVDVAADVLDLDAVVYQFDDCDNELGPAAWSPTLESTFGSPPRLDPNGSIAWETFVTGESAVYDDVRDADAVYDETTDARSGLYVPLGEHGVLVALSTGAGEYDAETVELVELFATTAEAALDRIGRTRRLHEREGELTQQNRHLERLNEANEVRQAIEQLLLLADSRDEIERGIPERLAAREECSLAWIGEPDPGGNSLRPRARAGRDHGYLDAVTATTVDDSAAEPAGRAARRREPVYVENVAASIHDGEWRSAALSRNVQSVYAVPLCYDGFLYGVLSIYGVTRDAFDETLRETLAELGETIGYAIDAVKRKNALVGDGRTEVKLEVDTETTLCRLADHLGTRVSYEGATAQADDSQLVFVAVDRTIDDVDAAVDLMAVDGADEVSSIVVDEAETLLQLRVTDPFLGSVVDAHGARLREFVADESGGRAIIDVPDAVGIREVLAGINRSGPSVSMVARREDAADDPSALAGPARNALLETFTDRQREVVQTAYHGGFFEWPRAATGEEIADSLDISSPAFHKHVRAVERKLFAALFEGATASEVN
ncbi:PAS domain S-box protein [Natrinema salifodinae]|uniref:PAS domain S-box-containing protein n=1 Tax=Natrinema salifodinae TaxID=1202768 RepID=A0A1I0ML18_9EURY|nr:PAS domain S-box protein [Natrinema salifodinae]SEV88580.1 PAS domain S-box-containing protein [Natrinema salifodinae]